MQRAKARRKAPRVSEMPNLLGFRENGHACGPLMKGGPLHEGWRETEPAPPTCVRPRIASAASARRSAAAASSRPRWPRRASGAPPPPPRVPRPRPVDTPESTGECLVGRLAALEALGAGLATRQTQPLLVGMLGRANTPSWAPRDTAQQLSLHSPRWVRRPWCPPQPRRRMGSVAAAAFAAPPSAARAAATRIPPPAPGWVRERDTQ